MSKPMLRATPLRVVGGLGQYGGYRLQRPGQYTDSVHGRLAPFEQVELRSLGVDPAFQWRGHAGTLLRHMLARLDAAGTLCYLAALDEAVARASAEIAARVRPVAAALEALDTIPCRASACWRPCWSP